MVTAEAPPVEITCKYKKLTDDGNFYNADNYVDTEEVVYPDPRSISAVHIHEMFTDATFVISNKGEEPLSFVFGHTSVNNTSSSETTSPEYTLTASTTTIDVGENATISFVCNPEDYTSKTAYSGTLIVFAQFTSDSETFDTAAFRIEWEVAVQGCTEECEEHGTCLNRVGYCKCSGHWMGPSCSSHFSISKDVLCPGEPFNISWSFAHSACEAYWSIYQSDVTFVSGDMSREGCIIGEHYPPIPSGSVPSEDTVLTETVRTYLPPGTYDLIYYNLYGEAAQHAFTLVVQDWETCGAAYVCDENSTSEGQCSGKGVCRNGSCECVASRFWIDCSRGCNDETRFTGRTGVVDSDEASDGQNSLYVPFTHCVWYIIPDGKTDNIEITFERFSTTTESDYLLVKKLGTSGKLDQSSKFLMKISGTSLPAPVKFPCSALALEFVTDYEGSSLGFRLSYEATVNPLSTGAIVTIGAMGFIVLAGIIVFIVFIVKREQNKREQTLKKALMAESEPWVPTSIEMESIESDKALPGTKTASEVDDELGWTNMKESVQFECTVHDLRFGLADRQPCPVMKELRQFVMLKNTSDLPISFCFFHPVDKPTLSCVLVPGKGTLAPGTGIRVEVRFTLMYTTKVDVSIKLAVWRGTRGPGSFYGFTDAEEGIPQHVADNGLDSKDSSAGVGTGGSSVCSTNSQGEPIDRAKRALMNNKAVTRTRPLCTARLTVHMEGAVSERIDPNEVVLNPDPLGVGAYGVVYSGRYRGRLVAVKVMSRQRDLLDQIIQDFEKEIDLYRKLHHPLVVDFVGASLIPGKLCMCTELIQRGSLEQLLCEMEVPLALQIRFATNIANAVAFLHSNNVLYRDLKPSNIMIVSTSLTSKINCKIGDFGTARNVKDVTEFFTYTSGQGTPIYMAPEVLNVRPYNNKADVYSFAITLWQMATRERPWSNVPVWDFPMRVIHGHRPHIPSSIPSEYADVIRACWAPDPDARPDFSEALARLTPIAKHLKKDFKQKGHSMTPSKNRIDLVQTAGDTVDFGVPLSTATAEHAVTATSSVDPLSSYSNTTRTNVTDM